MSGLDLRLPDDVRVRSVQDLAWDDVALDFLLADVAPADFAATRVAADPRFVNVATGSLRMSFHSLVVETRQATVLIDTCIGNDKERLGLPAFHQQRSPYLQRLAALGLRPEDIDVVCCTHLHGDHVGWNTRLQSGVWVPTFPNARYLFARSELDYWEQQIANESDSPYAQPWRDSVLPVIESGCVDAVASDHEIVSGMRLQPAPGHTPGNVVVRLGAAGAGAVLSGDVLHHPAQIERPEWASVFDEDPRMACATRTGLLAEVAAQDAWLIGAHFAGAAALRIAARGAAFAYRD